MKIIFCAPGRKSSNNVDGAVNFEQNGPKNNCCWRWCFALLCVFLSFLCWRTSIILWEWRCVYNGTLLWRERAARGVVMLLPEERGKSRTFIPARAERHGGNILFWIQCTLACAAESFWKWSTHMRRGVSSYASSRDSLLSIHCFVLILYKLNKSLCTGVKLQIINSVLLPGVKKNNKKQVGLRR